MFFGKKENVMHSSTDEVKEEYATHFVAPEEAMKGIKNEIDVNVASNVPFLMVLMFDPIHKVIVNKIIRGENPERDNPN